MVHRILYESATGFSSGTSYIYGRHYYAIIIKWKFNWIWLILSQMILEGPNTVDLSVSPIQHFLPFDRITEVLLRKL